MAITQERLYNGALRLLGERKISLAEERLARRLLDDVWDEDAIKFCLEMGQWQFATRTVRLEVSPNVSPDWGYAFAFELPDDYIRTTKIASDEYFYNVMTQFSQEAGFLFADITEIYLGYVSNDDAYGRDLGRWPLTFSKFVQAYLAFEVSNRLTGVKVDMGRIEKEYEKRLTKAQAIDGVNRPTVFPDRGSWNDSRHGRYTRFVDRRR